MARENIGKNDRVTLIIIDIIVFIEVMFLILVVQFFLAVIDSAQLILLQPFLNPAKGIEHKY